MRNTGKSLDVHQRELNGHHDGGYDGHREKTLHQSCDKE